MRGFLILEENLKTGTRAVLAFFAAFMLAVAVIPS
jgi:hypothetical protein